MSAAECFQPGVIESFQESIDNSTKKKKIKESLIFVLPNYRIVTASISREKEQAGEEA